MENQNLDNIQNIIKTIQPYYNELNSKYSKSYLEGSIWYVGDDLLEWWKKSNNIRYYKKNITKLRSIVELLLIYKKNLLK